MKEGRKKTFVLIFHFNATSSEGAPQEPEPTLCDTLSVSNLKVGQHATSQEAQVELRP